MDYKKLKERSDKLLLNTEILLLIFGIFIVLVTLYIPIFTDASLPLKIVSIITGVLVFIATFLYCVRIEQVAGYYECPRCSYRYVPKFSKMLFSPSFGRARKMKCVACGRDSWHEKVLTIDDNK